MMNLFIWLALLSAIIFPLMYLVIYLLIFKAWPAIERYKLRHGIESRFSYLANAKR